MKLTQFWVENQPRPLPFVPFVDFCKFDLGVRVQPSLRDLRKSEFFPALKRRAIFTMSLRDRPLVKYPEDMTTNCQAPPASIHSERKPLWVKLSANATAFSMAFDLFTVSWNSASGVESLTQPPPACT